MVVGDDDTVDVKAGQVEPGHDDQVDAGQQSSGAEPVPVDDSLVGTGKGILTGLVRGARPKQWIVNLLVFAVPVVTRQIGEPGVLVATGLAFVTFCLATSGVCLINDARDVEGDRAHPDKCQRPVAAGLVPVRVANWVGFPLLAVAVGLGLLMGPLVAAVLAVYAVVQLGYCFCFGRNQAIYMVVIAVGYLLRIVAGAVAAEFTLSPLTALVICLAPVFISAGMRRV